MKILEEVFFGLVVGLFIAMLFFFGFIAGKYSQPQNVEPTPEECLNVCVEEFEKFGC